MSAQSASSTAMHDVPEEKTAVAENVPVKTQNQQRTSGLQFLSAQQNDESSKMFAEQVDMERAALEGLVTVRDAASKRIELWKKFCEVFDQLQNNN